MAIAPDGEVVPCQKLVRVKMQSFGNMLKDKWEDIWNNPKCKK